MKMNFKSATYIGFIIIVCMVTYAIAEVYDYSSPVTLGGTGLGLWSGDMGTSWPQYYEPGHYEWQPIEYCSQLPRLMKSVLQDSMFWILSPKRSPELGSYPDPDPSHSYYYIPEGQHYYTGARWFAPEGEVIAKIEFSYAGYIGLSGAPQFSIFAGTGDTPDLMYYMSSLNFFNYTPVPFSLDFSPNNHLKSLEIRCWDAYEGDNVADSTTVFMKFIKVTTATEPSPLPLTCEEIWALGQGMQGDINRDCIVNFADFAQFAEQFMMSNNPE